MSKKPTYTATRNDGRVIYSKRPDGNLIGELPIGYRPEKFAEGEDPFNGAVFKSFDTGRVVTIKRD